MLRRYQKHRERYKRKLACLSQGLRVDIVDSGTLNNMNMLAIPKIDSPSLTMLAGYMDSPATSPERKDWILLI